jgi:hypothetical protein
MAGKGSKVKKAAPIDPTREVHSEGLKVLHGDDELLAEMLEAAEQNVVRPMVTKLSSRPVKAEQDFGKRDLSE